MKPSSSRRTKSPAASNPTNRPAEGQRAARRTSTSSPYAESLLERFASTPPLQAFHEVIGAAGIETLLGGEGPLTIFAPTNRAFARLPDEQRSALLNDSKRCADFIRHHVVAGRVKAPRAAAPRTVTPEFGNDLELTASDQGFRVGGARIVRTNIRATNGVIHAIDRVLEIDEAGYVSPTLTKVDLL